MIDSYNKLAFCVYLPTNDIINNILLHAYMPESYLKESDSDLENIQSVLVAIGGNEDKDKDLDVLKQTVLLHNKKEPCIELITTASSMPKESGASYIAAFEKIGVMNVKIMDIRKREQTGNPEYIERLKAADVIFFTGGDQLRITSILGGTPVLETIKSRYFNEKCVIAGTSAGASAMSEIMIYEGEVCEALCKGKVQLTSGIGLIKNVVIDSHFIKRGRFSRLMDIVTTNPGTIGLGLGEDTGVVIRQGHILESIGSGLTVIFDGQHIKYTNISDIQIGAAIAVENVWVHTLAKGHGYNLLTRKYITPSEIGGLTY
jgi:cyanophycinase